MKIPKLSFHAGTEDRLVSGKSLRTGSAASNGVWLLLEDSQPSTIPETLVSCHEASEGSALFAGNGDPLLILQLEIELKRPVQRTVLQFHRAVGP